MVDDYMLEKLLDKTFDDTKILIETNDKLPNDITLKSIMNLIIPL